MKKIVIVDGGPRKREQVEVEVAPKVWTKTFEATSAFLRFTYII